FPTRRSSDLQEVDLVGRQAEFAANRVLDLDIEFWSVEGRFARRFDKWVPTGAQRLTGGVLSPLPDGGVAHPLVAGVIPQGEPKIEIRNAEGAIDLKDQLDHALEFLIQLIGPAENVCVVDGEGAHPNQARNLPRLLIPVDRAQLGNPHRELAEAVSLSLEDTDVMRTVHGPQLPLLLLHLRGGVHGIAIALEMTADLVNVEPGDVRRLDVLVALPPLEAEDELLHLTPDGGAFGRQQRQPAANHLVDQEEVELF